MSNKNTLEAKRMRREVKVYDKHYPDFWVKIMEVLAPLEDGIEDTRNRTIKLVPSDKALRLTKGFMIVGDRVVKLNPRWVKL